MPESLVLQIVNLSLDDVQTLGKRPSSSPLSLSPAKRRQSRRMSKRSNGRRVSFAPDPELTMIHMFEKVGCTMA